MAELRPHLEATSFVKLLRRLAGLTGLRLAYLTEGDVKAVAGLKLLANEQDVPYQSLLKVYLSDRVRAERRHRRRPAGT